MSWWHVELYAVDGWVKTFVVKAKTYPDACTAVAKLEGEGEFKLLGHFEVSTVDKNIIKRIK